jgi:hypothetical protein
LDEAGHPGGSARTQQHQITRSRANHRITRFSVAGRSVVKFCGFPTFDDHAVIVYVKYCKQTTYVNIQDVRNQEFFSTTSVPLFDKPWSAGALACGAAINSGEAV